MKIPAHTRNPYTAVRAVVDPPAMRPKLVVKHVEIHASVVIVLFFVVAGITVSLRVHVVPWRAARPEHERDYRENDGVS